MTRIFLFRYAELKEIELEDCQKRYDQFLSSGRQRRRAHLTENQMCAGDDKVFLEEICVKGPCKASRRIWPLSVVILGDISRLTHVAVTVEAPCCI